MAEKLFYSMGEVAEMFDVNTSLVRHWESQFSVLKPKRNKKGNRLFTPADVENLKLIYHLVKERGMTLEGARKALKQNRGDAAMSRDVELLERLQRVRSLLVEVREELKSGEGEILAGESESSQMEMPRKPRTKPVVKIAEEEASDAAQTADSEATVESMVGKLRRPRRKKEDAEPKELFAFYEQSLF